MTEDGPLFFSQRRSVLLGVRQKCRMGSTKCARWVISAYKTIGSEINTVL